MITRGRIALAMTLIAGCATSSKSTTTPTTNGELGTLTGLTKTEIISGISPHASEVRACYETRFAQKAIVGTLMVQFVIAPNGSVASAKIRRNDSTVVDEPMETCVLASAQTWRFTEPRAGEKVTVNFPFFFTAVQPNALQGCWVNPASCRAR